MAIIAGYVEKIKYRNDENGYSVLSVTDVTYYTTKFAVFQLGAGINISRSGWKTR